MSSCCGDAVGYLVPIKINSQKVLIFNKDRNRQVTSANPIENHFEMPKTKLYFMHEMDKKISILLISSVYVKWTLSLMNLPQMSHAKIQRKKMKKKLIKYSK